MIPVPRLLLRALLFGPPLVLGLALLAWAVPEPAPPASPRQNEPAALPPPAAFRLPPISAFPETTARPLFSPGRQADEQRRRHGEGPATAGSEAARFELSAIAISGDERFALINDRQAGVTARVRVEEGLGGWRVARIDSAGVLLRRKGENLQLPLRRFAAPGTIPAPTPVPESGPAAQPARAPTPEPGVAEPPSSEKSAEPDPG